MTSRAKREYVKRRLKIRNAVFPGLREDELWDRKQKVGFTTIPRPLPLLHRCMDTLSKNKPLASTYLDLWCRTFDDNFIVLDKASAMAFAAGFTGGRRVHTWAERLDILAELGFIRLAEGDDGPRSYAVILNPYEVIKQHRARLPADLYNALIARSSSVGADDMDDE